MTLPNDIIYPLDTDLLREGDFTSLKKYIRLLVESLTERDRQVVDVVNGTIQMFSPILKGSTVAGVGTYNYQTGWYLRQGLMVDIWFDISWSAHTGTGNLYVELPYTVANSENNPFVGTLNSSNITYTAGYTAVTCRAEPNTIKCNIMQYGSGVALAVIAVPASGAISGHIRYIGKEFE